MVLFIDIDGVLHPRPIIGRTGEHELFASLHLLEDVLRQVPHVEVVISSSWRERHPFDEMREYFAEDLRDRIVDVTPLPPLADVPPHLSDHQRHAECLAWLTRHRPAGTRWVALDDNAEEFAPGCENLLLVDGTQGLTPESAAQLLHCLQSGRMLGEVLETLPGRQSGETPRLQIRPHLADVAPTLRLPQEFFADSAGRRGRGKRSGA
jgi:hypothetical protein